MQNPNRKKAIRSIIWFLLTMLLIFLIAHRDDVKKGAVEGFRAGVSNGNK
ncbi:hypothetical protein [Mucilaginibacter sp.]